VTDNAFIHEQDNSNIRDSLNVTKKKVLCPVLHSSGFTKTALGDTADIECEHTIFFTKFVSVLEACIHCEEQE